MGANFVNTDICNRNVLSDVNSIVMKIKFMLEYSNSPFWAIDEESKKKYGYNINLEELNLSKSSRVRINSIMKLYKSKLNPVYQGFPSLWSGRMSLFFQMFLKQVYSEVELELRDLFEIINHEEEFINDKIDVEQIDEKLKEFVSNPSKYADDNRISYKSKEELTNKIKNAKEVAEKLEFEWTTI